MTSLPSPPPVPDTFPRTAAISASNPLGLPNFGARPIAPLKITNARIRHETPGSVSTDSRAFIVPPNVLKELLPYVAQLWGPEQTAGNNNLCGIYALTAALKNIMGHMGEQVPPWVDFTYLQNEMQSDAFKTSVERSITHQVSSVEPERAPDGTDQESWNVLRQITIEDGVRELMEEYNHQNFYGVEQLSRFLRYLNEKHQVHYRLGVVVTQTKPQKKLRPPTIAYISEDPNSLPGRHYPVVWLHNHHNYHWESIGPKLSRRGRTQLDSWKLRNNVKIVVENGLYLVETDIVGAEAQYELTAPKNQWLYEVTPPERLESREGYIYVHTTNGPNADAWRVVTAGQQDSQDTIRGQEGFVPMAALKATTRYGTLRGTMMKNWITVDVTKRAGAVLSAKRKRCPEEEAAEGPNKRPTVDNAPTPSRNLELDPPSSTPINIILRPAATTSMNIPPNPAPSAPITVSPRPPAANSINITSNPAPSAPVTVSPKPPAANSINITSNPVPNASNTVTSRPAITMAQNAIRRDPMMMGSVRMSAPTLPYSEYFRLNPIRLFRVTVPYKAPWVPGFKEGYLSYSDDQILLALDYSYEDDKSRPCRVRDSRMREGWGDPRFLHEIEMPFGIHRSRVCKPVSSDDAFAYPEDQYSDDALRTLCTLHAQSTVGTRQDLMGRLREERDTQGVPLMLWTTTVAGGGFERNTKVRVEGDPTIDPDAQYVAYGLDGAISKGVVWGNQLERNRYTWGLRVLRHHCGIPEDRDVWLDNWYRSQRQKAWIFHARALQKFPHTARPSRSPAPVARPTFGFGDPGRDLGDAISPRVQAFVQSVPGSMAPPPMQSGGQRTTQPELALPENCRKIVQDMMQPALPWTRPPPPAGIRLSFWKDHLHKKRMEEGGDDGDDGQDPNEYVHGDPWKPGDD